MYGIMRAGLHSKHMCSVRSILRRGDDKIVVQREVVVLGVKDIEAKGGVELAVMG
jgi:hypothetical protein